MRKKVYKKNKKVVEKIIYQRTQAKGKLTLSNFFLITSLIYFISIIYDFTILSFINDTAKPTINRIVEHVGSIQVVGEKPTFVPFSPNWQQALLKKKPVISSTTKQKIATKEKSQQDQIIWHGPRDKKEVALTFDADMTPIMVDWLHSGHVSTYDDTRITDYLMQNQIKATFFLTGLWIESYPEATKQLADNSLFELENHTYSHPSMAGYCFGQPQIPLSQYPSEIEKTQALIEQYTHQAPKYFRFSGGCYDKYSLDLVKKEGLVTVHWDDVADDGFNSDREAIIHNVLSEAQNGSIIVMHIGGQPNTPETANALPVIIQGLKDRGFQFVTVSELLHPPTVAKISPKEYLTSLESFQTLFP